VFEYEQEFEDEQIDEYEQIKALPPHLIRALMRTVLERP
jgi:hypothetical protein